MDDGIQEKQIDLREYLQVLVKRRWTILSLFLIVLLTVAVSTYTATPIYRATARIVIEKENPNLVSFEEVMAVDTTGSDYYQTQYKIIESRNVAREVIRRLDLANSEEFNPPPKKDLISRSKARIMETGSAFKGWLRSFFKVTPPSPVQAGAETPAQMAGAQTASSGSGFQASGQRADSKLVTAFIRRVNVRPIPNSRLVDVSVMAMDARMAAQMANTLVQAYIDRNLETKLNATKDAVKWLVARIDEERTKVEAAENSLLQYKQDHSIITDFSSETEQITAQKLAQLNAQVVEAEAKRVEAETRYQQASALVDRPEMLDSIPEVLTNELIREIKKMEVTLYNRMSELSKKYGRNHPQMVAIDSELADLTKRKAREVKRVVNSLRNEYKLALAREDSLKKAFSGQKAETLELNKKAIQYSVLSRQAESARNMYELLVKRFKETSLSEEMKTGNIRIVDEAEPKFWPVKPNKKRNLLLGVILGLTLGIGLAFLLEYLDNTIKLPDEIREYLRIPYLGPVPVFDTETAGSKPSGDLVTLNSPKATASESFRGIRTGILFSSADVAPNVIMVTSAGPAEGKTLCTTNLAVTMAQAGSKVVVVDCDMRRPRIHKVFQLSRDIGLSNVLVGSAKLEDAIVKTDVDNLDFIPSGPIPPNPSEILGSRRMLELLKVLRQKYKRIIIDTAPITAVADALVMSRAADGVLLVIRAGDTPRQIVQSGLSQLQTVDAHILGAVLNGVKTGRDNYYYYQYYYYYYGDDGDRKKKNRKKKRSRGKYGEAGGEEKI